MGLGTSTLTEPEESEEPEEQQEDDENNTLKEKFIQPNSNRREGNKALPNETRHPSKANESGPTNAKLAHELQMGKIIEEKNNSERIIREKELLLREREETIRQQADLIKSQSRLLGQRKRISQSNIDVAKVHYDVIFKPRILKPATEPTQFSGSLASHEIVRSNGNSNGPNDLRHALANNDCEKKYFFDRINVVKPILPTHQEQSNQIFNSPTSFANSQINPSTLGIPFPHRWNSTSLAVPYHQNAPLPNNKALSTPTSTIQARKCQSNDYRRKNMRDDDARQSTNQLLEDLEKQTNYELRNLNNVQNGNSSNQSVVDVNTNSGDRKLKPVKSFHCIFKCPRCSVTWKSKIASLGKSQKCKKCGCDVGSKLMEKNWKDDERRSQNVSKSNSERISDVD